MGVSALALATLSTLAIAPGHAHANVGKPSPRRQVDGLWVSPDGRRRVRGGRGQSASIHDAWIADARGFDEEAREALAAFERATFPPDAGVVERAPKPWMKDLRRPTLPLRWTRRLLEYLDYFKDNPKGRLLMRGWLRRAGRYEETLRSILADAGVPEDLVFVALAESGFKPTVRSRVGAAGMWQFMEATGKVYGLSVDYWVDERHDIVKSTRAAALYLADLHTRFGTWELALAAFNAGYGLVMVSIDRHNTNDFWALADIESGLPYATTNYVPKIFAASLVGENREAFGFADKDIDPMPKVEWIEVRVPGKTSLAKLAKKIGQDDDLIAELNAQYIRGRTPPRKLSPVRIPREAKAAFESAYPSLADEAVAIGEYTMRHGDRLAAIAERFGTTEHALRRFNKVGDSAELSGGVVIVIPPADDTPATAGDTGKRTAKKTAKKSPAEDFKLLAAVPPIEVPSGTRRVLFRTNRASTPRAVAQVFDRPWRDIVAWNGLDARARLQSGQLLQIVVPASFDAGARGVAIYEENEVDLVTRGSREHIEGGLARRGLERRAYKAKKGDSLAKVARRFDLTIGDLARINAFSRSHALAVGELVLVYVPKSKRGVTVMAPDPVLQGAVARGGVDGGYGGGSGVRVCVHGHVHGHVHVHVRRRAARGLDGGDGSGAWCGRAAMSRAAPLLPSVAVADAVVTVRREASARRPLAVEELDLGEAADRVLAETLTAGWPIPAADVSMMDGWAVRSADIVDARSCGTSARVVLDARGTSAAGHPGDARLIAGQAGRIFTGAVLPAGADAVVPQEDVEVAEDGSTITLDPEAVEALEPGRFVRVAGSEIDAGDELLRPGAVLSATELALLATAGHARVRVFRRPRVAILSTGDELVRLGQRPGPGQIVSTNSIMLATQVRQAGGEPIVLPEARDEVEALREALRIGMEADVLVTSGGISVGEHDLVRGQLEALGTEVHFHGLALRPGKPALFGTCGDTLVFALPGNPASTWVGFLLLVLPALAIRAGQAAPRLPMRLPVTVDAKVGGAGKRAHYVRGRWSGPGLVATPLSAQRSGNLRSIAEVDVLLVVPAGVERIEAGQTCEAIVLRPPAEPGA